MKKQDLESIIAKYRKFAGSLLNDEEASEYYRFADYVEDYLEQFEDHEFYETEEDLLRDFNEAESEIDPLWEDLYPIDDDDNSM